MKSENQKNDCLIEGAASQEKDADDDLKNGSKSGNEELDNSESNDKKNDFLNDIDLQELENKESVASDIFTNQELKNTNQSIISFSLNDVNYSLDKNEFFEQADCVAKFQYQKLYKDLNSSAQKQINQYVATKYIANIYTAYYLSNQSENIEELKTQNRIAISEQIEKKYQARLEALQKEKEYEMSNLENLVRQKVYFNLKQQSIPNKSLQAHFDDMQKRKKSIWTFQYLKFSNMKDAKSVKSMIENFMTMEEVVQTNPSKYMLHTESGYLSDCAHYLNATPQELSSLQNKVCSNVIMISNTEYIVVVYKNKVPVVLDFENQKNNIAYHLTKMELDRCIKEIIDRSKIQKEYF